MLLNIDEINLQRPTRNSEVTPIERASIIIYRRNFGFDNEKKKFWGKINVWKEEEGNDKDGRFMSYRHGEEAREVSQSKERRKLGWGQKMSYEG